MSLRLVGIDGLGVLLPNENVRPPARREKAGCDSGTGGTGTPYGVGCFRGLWASSGMASVEDGAVEELLSRVEEALSVKTPLEEEFVFDPPLPLSMYNLSVKANGVVLVPRLPYRFEAARSASFEFNPLV